MATVRDYPADQINDADAINDSERQGWDALQAHLRDVAEQSPARRDDVARAALILHDMGKSKPRFQLDMAQAGIEDMSGLLADLSDGQLDISLQAIESAAQKLETAAIGRARTVALLSAGRERIDRIQSETRVLLDQLMEAR